MSERLRREILAARRDLLQQPAHGPGRAGAARLGHRRGGVAARASTGWRWCCTPPTGAARTCRASATWSTSSSPPCATRCRRAEESWVNDPANAWRMQRQPGWLASRLVPHPRHNALRLRWQLLDACARRRRGARGLPDPARGTRPQPRRASLKALLADGKAPGFDALSPRQQAVAREALRDLDLTPGRDPRREPGRRLGLSRAGPARRPGDAGDAKRWPGSMRCASACCAPGRAHVPGVVGRDARPARRRSSSRSPRGWTRARRSRPVPDGGRAADRRAASPARRAARRPCTSACMRRTSRAA